MSDQIRGLTNTQRRALADMQGNDGGFIRWPTGVWARKDCLSVSSKGNKPIPIWWVTWTTIEVMLRRGVIEVTKRNTKKEPIAVDVVAQP